MKYSLEEIESWAKQGQAISPYVMIDLLKEVQTMKGHLRVAEAALMKIAEQTGGDDELTHSAKLARLALDHIRTCMI